MPRSDLRPNVTMQLPVDQTAIDEQYPNDVPSSVGRPDLIAAAQRVSPGILGSFTGPDTIDYGGNQFRLSLNPNGSLVWDRIGASGGASYPAQIGGIPGGSAPYGGGTSGAGIPGTPDQRDAAAVLRSILDQYGLGSLSDWAWGLITSGASQAEVLAELRKRPEYERRFPAMKLRQQAGFAPISEADYVAYENAARQYAKASGLPAGFVDGRFTDLIGGDTSLAELKARVDVAKEASYYADPDTLTALSSMFGLAPGDGGLAAYYLDPKTALPLLERGFQEARIGGASLRTGYGALSESEARTLVQQGVSADQAQQGFSQLGAEQELFAPLPGEAGTAVSRSEQFGAAFSGDSAAQRRIENRARQRLAQNQGGGQLSGSQQGISGLGSAST